MIAVGLFFIAWLMWTIVTIDRAEAVELNLLVRGEMAQIGDSFTVKISPTTAAGTPASVTDQGFLVNFAVYDLTVSTDRLSAVVTAKGLGSSKIKVSAKSLSGVTLTDEKQLPDVLPVEATALNLVIV